MMKKQILSVILLLVFGIFTSLNVNSAVLPLIVNGHVYASDGHTPISGVDVTVKCNELTQIDTTNSVGHYAVEFLEGCNTGDTVTVSVGDFSESGIVADRTFTKNIVYINLSVPEFTLVTGLTALAGAALVFMFIRRK